ncbi:MAG: CRISPR-associated endonuclease Cas2 [Candidatus Omnitrophica bacterium]|nr:CRISPR-associated endonuclease Cas2 [Candidatus Omnitrophota bacterium]
MKVIFIYDIELKENKDQKRLNKIKKIGRRYLTHIQKSVFEGELTESQIYRMENDVSKVIDKERDSVIFYILPDGVKLTRKILSNLTDKTKNVL